MYVGAKYRVKMYLPLTTKNVRKSFSQQVDVGNPRTHTSLHTNETRQDDLGHPGSGLTSAANHSPVNYH